MSLRRATLTLVSATGAFALARKLRGAAPFALELHGVCSTRRPGARALEPSFSAAELECLLRWLAPRFRFLDPEGFLGGSGAGVLLTFDDGFANHYSVVLPLLERYQAPAVFFVAVQHVIDPQDWLPSVRRALAAAPAAPPRSPELEADLFDGLAEAQLRALSQHPLVTIGAHTTSHPLLTQLDDDHARAELVNPRRYLAERSPRPVDLLAYPSGDYDRRIAWMAQEAGYRAAFAERSLGLGVGDFEIERIGLYHCDPGYLAAKLSGLFGRPYRAPAPARRPLGQGHPVASR